ncbi:MAG: guanosine monophosphate reductase [Haloglomus sp.]
MSADDPALRTGLTYDDVLVVPARSPVGSRSDVSLATNLTDGLALDAPVLSAPMDTVTGPNLAVALHERGGFSTIHRFQTVADQAADVRQAVDRGARVGAALGIDEQYLDRAEAVLEAGADCLMVDVAHGHMEAALDAVETVASEFDAPLVAGNVATAAGVADLAAAGADAVKVGVGPGSHCTTREVAGAGVPQFTAVRDCARAAADHGVRTIADGGVSTSGDAVKALLAGADTVMMGGFFAGTEEAPGELVEHDGSRYKRSHGMASTAANEARSDKSAAQSAPEADEGVAGLVPYQGPVASVLSEFLAGIRSGMSYAGGHTLAEARDGVEFIRVTEAAKARSGAHTFVRDGTRPARRE